MRPASTLTKCQVTLPFIILELVLLFKKSLRSQLFKVTDLLKAAFTIPRHDRYTLDGFSCQPRLGLRPHYLLSIIRGYTNSLYSASSLRYMSLKFPVLRKKTKSKHQNLNQYKIRFVKSLK